jgi:hypothetical protein
LPPWFFLSKKTVANKQNIYRLPFCLLAVAACLSKLVTQSQRTLSANVLARVLFDLAGIPAFCRVEFAFLLLARGGAVAAGRQTAANLAVLLEWWRSPEPPLHQTSF